MGGSPVQPAWKFDPPPAPDQGSPGFGNQVDMKLFRVNPPSLLYITRDDQLMVRVLNNQNAIITLHIRGRIFTLDGFLVPFDLTLKANNVTTTEQVFQLAEGFLLDVAIRADGVSIQRGQMYTQAFLARGNEPNVLPTQLLIAGFIVGQQPIGWPFALQESPVNAQGSILSTSVANPAAGSDFNFQLPNAQRGKIRGVIATLTTSATAATRGVRVQIKDNAGNVLYQAPGNITQAASLTQIYNFSAAPYPTTAIAGEAFIPIPPDCLLGVSWQIASLTNNIQVGDQWSSIFVWDEQWFDSIT